LDQLPDRTFAGCEHVSAGVLGPLDWRYNLPASCECCGRGALARHPTKPRRIRCEDCGGVIRPRGVPRGKERWVIAVDIEIPADVTSEEQAGRIASKLLDDLAADPRLKDFVGGVIVRPWAELDELL
jgi:hypothetical protein